MQTKSNTVGLLSPASLLSAAALAMLASASVRAIAPMGDGAELFVTGVASASYNDNIFLSHNNAKTDYIFNLVPGLAYDFGKNNSQTSGELSANEDFRFFSKHSGLNSNLSNVALWTKFDDSKTTLSFDASFHQLDQADRGSPNLTFLVKRDVYHVDGLGEVQATEKSSVGGGIIFDDTVYKNAGFTNWKYWQVPLNYYWKLEPKLDLSAGFRYQDNTLGVNGIDSKVYYYNVGARGEFTPNLTGKFTVGYLQADFARGRKKSGLGMDGSFTYAYSPKTNVVAGVSDDYGYAASGASYRDLGGHIGANSNLNDQWIANASLGYDRYTYTVGTQKDDFYTVSAGLTYIISTNVTVTGSYSYATDSSSNPIGSFKNNILSFAANFRY